MSKFKPSIPKGTRDFTPEEMIRRNYIFDTIRSVFRLFGYLPIETPAMENLSTLLGKYGEEGDKLLFRILNSGNYLEGIDPTCSGTENLNKFTLEIAEKGLRYDLTVPFARFVVMHQQDIVFPFKRYQIQPVWRADRPQKGRYREFFQCDVDVIGSDSLLNEIELIQITDMVFDRLGLGVVVKINNRKILSGIAEMIGAADKIIDFTVAVDKLEKIGLEGVNKELLERGISESAISKLRPLLSLGNHGKESMLELQQILGDSPAGVKGIAEAMTILDYAKTLGLTSEVEFDITLARGLNYYTGSIIEVKSTQVPMGSVCGGGRYDDLTGIFGLPGVSGVGISFGADRIYDVMQALNLFSSSLMTAAKVMFLNFGAEEERYCMTLLGELRKQGIAAELYPDAAKIKKQMEYANRKNIPFVVLAGKEEISSGKLSLKDMVAGDQRSMTPAELLDFFKV